MSVPKIPTTRRNGIYSAIDKTLGDHEKFGVVDGHSRSVAKILGKCFLLTLASEATDAQANLFDR